VRLAALPLLACPACRAALLLADRAPAADGHVVTGSLACAALGCGARYPIAGGVPRLLPPGTAPLVAATADRFGSQWKIFDHMAPHQEEWLRAWLEPIGPAEIRGRVVFEAGCGKGRHSVVVGGWGARDLVALDLSEAVDVAFAHARALENVHVVQGDLLAPPVPAGRFDLAFSIGVLHHLPDPKAGFDALRAQVRLGGRVAIWVYGRESNEWIVRFVSPARERLTARLPPGLLYWATLPPSAGLAAAARLWPRRLPYGAYMRRLAGLPVREVHNIVFDQLVTPVAHYLPEDEVRRWLAAPDLTEVRLAHHNGNSWRASARIA
jgi:SAM-dependent methyltransferase